MRILVLSYFFEPDLSAGSFRNSALIKTLEKKPEISSIDVITTFPNRYSSFKAEVEKLENRGKTTIYRIAVPEHKNGLFDQILSFRKYFNEVNRLVSNKEYDIVYASSSKLFTAFLGRIIAKRKRLPLYLDIRDIFVDSIGDLLKGKPYLPLLKIILTQFEKFTFSRATHINLVSEGFKTYFERYKQPNYTYYTNGIDNEFLTKPKLQVNNNLNKVKVITYAGNIGEGQGLHAIIPEAASRLEGRFTFQVIGAGGAKNKLVEELEKRALNNVTILDPVKRIELIQIYEQSDYLFLHLNNFKAFENVLPSKLFEYAVFDKPIIAGVGGYAAKFIRDNIENKILFKPCDVESFIEQINLFEYSNSIRAKFIADYNRDIIMNNLADTIITYAKLQ